MDSVKVSSIAYFIEQIPVRKKPDFTIIVFTEKIYDVFNLFWIYKRFSAEQVYLKPIRVTSFYFSAEFNDIVMRLDKAVFSKRAERTAAVTAVRQMNFEYHI